MHGLNLKQPIAVRFTSKLIAAVKLPSTTLLRALGYPTNAGIKELFADVDTGETNYIDATLEKDPAKGTNEALIEVYRRLRPGDLATVDNARGMIERMFFDFKRFDY